jgi:transposase-like protein
MIKKTSPIRNAMRNATNNETAAVEFLEAQRWGDPACPRCGDLDVYQMKVDDQRNKDFRWRCRGCKQMFTVRTRTTFEETRLPLRVWVYAIWKACSSKKGISALQLAREMEITHKSALCVLRRVRDGLGEHDQPKFTNTTIEVDEVYVGGKPRYKGVSGISSPLMGVEGAACSGSGAP